MKSQGLPTYVIAIIIIALVVLAFFLLYAFGVVGKGTHLWQNLTNVSNKTLGQAQEASEGI